MPVIGQVPWHQLDQPSFDRIVEALLVRYHQERGEHADALDGRGGDGGRDVDVHVGPDLEELDTIYQLKFFPEGFSGDHGKSRRPQIKKSFEKAIKDRPRRWVLVIPRNATPKERQWVRALAQKRKVEVAVWGRAKLDAELAARPDLLAAATRDALVDVMRIMGQEKAALTGPGDLAERLRDLHSVANGRSAFWGSEFSVGADGGVVETLIAKRPDAHLREPIVHTFNVFGDRLGQDERTALQLVAQYGIGSVALPPDAISDMKTTGPEWAPRPGAGDIIELGGRPRLHDPVVVRTVDEDKVTIRSVRGWVEDVGEGGVGRGVVLECSGGLGVTLLLNRGDSAATLNVTQAMSGENAQDALQAIELVESIPTATGFEVLRGSSVLISLRTGPDVGPVVASAPAYERQLIEDLAVIAAYSRMPFDVPDSLTTHARCEIRRLRLILDGRAILEPAFGRLTTTLRKDIPERLRDSLGGEFAIAITASISYDVMGQAIQVKDAVVYHPRAHGEYLNPTDEKAPSQMVIRGVDDSPFWVYAPGRLPDGERSQLSTLDIPGFTEPPLPAYVGNNATVVSLSH
ncbi:hypothetical protein [Cellulomonas sp. HD19AZ1]|uniref:hypothetical protein n=1 Tax=Cellulomonas sp. HD19AZ1 TaxID=2559593 RepID=UPI001070C874|nr:hypothetical protein [Cellulomonas sp. HD19AZ1]TFH72911.1 hypothetical protein E4A51_05720 [Cellulomonas sp. HD19AZ1]